MDAATGNDKNEGGLGAILCQTHQNGDNKFIAYASRQLLKHEKTTRHSYWKWQPLYGQWNTLTHT